MEKLLKNKKKLIVEEGLENLFDNNLTYGFKTQSDLQILNIEILNSCYQFDIKYRNKIHKNFAFKMPGNYNLLNAAGAVLSCLENEIKMEPKIYIHLDEKILLIGGTTFLGEIKK